ncbi:MAG TPA: hypothetical protein DCS82_00600 [Rhodospirillaceae bacterium]|nr:hypothetical protein [Rhodospirillaceae bacterium]HAA93402.1 hypothetical protein [Rhodospirillaceae bacterium]HAT34187.1 hypothetical protein [Rhodospirillaceae bacterium]|tara:strand:+ start:469 stop:1758 length:1290 start_codon:yes stop_codon:yes gene_type:complete
MRFLFVTVIWGAKYVDDFLKYSLPTQLAWGNLADFPWADGSTYLIITTDEDRARLRSSSLFKRLERNITVKFGDLKDTPLHNKYIGVSMAQLEGLKQSSDYDAVFFIYPDFVCATGTIQYCAQKMVDGFDAVMFPVPAVLETIFSDPAIRDNNVVTRSIDGDIIAIPPRLLVDASMRNFHPMISGYFVEGVEKHNIGTAYMMWDVPEYGWLFRCFHLHPFCIRVDKENPNFLVEFNVSLDEEYVPRVFGSVDRIHFPDVSDLFAMCSLREPDSPPQPQEGAVRVDTIINWAEEYASLVHRDFVLQPFIWTHRSPEEEGALKRWSQARQKSLRYVDTIRERLNTPDSLLRFENHAAFEARRRRRRRFQSWRIPIRHDFDTGEVEQNSPDILPTGRLGRFLIWLKGRPGIYKLRRVPGLLYLWRRIFKRLR